MFWAAKGMGKGRSVANRLWLCASASLVGALVFSASALAQTPAEQVYGGEGGNIQEDIAGAGAAGGILPFTGLDLLLMALAAMLLIGTGVTMRLLASAKT